MRKVIVRTATYWFLSYASLRQSLEFLLHRDRQAHNALKLFLKDLLNH